MPPARPPLAPSALAVAWAAWLSGCTSYSSPTLHVVDARVAERTPDGVVMLFTLEAENPNAVALPLREARYDVWLDGRQVFSGYRSPEATIRRFATQQVVLPAVVTSADAGTLAGSSVGYRLSGTLLYTTPGEIEEILFDNEIRRPTVGFSQAGTLDLTSESR